MADVIGLINDISTSVKLAWMGALAWTAIQVMWYRRGRVPAGTAEPVASSWSAGHQFPSVTRPPETEPVEAPALYLFGADGAAEEVEVESEEAPEVVAATDELAEFFETGRPRRRAGRRRRSNGGVADFTLDTPKATS